jgi:hypothetical protein
MWIELDVMMKDQTINLSELGFHNLYHYNRRLVKVDEIYFLQELLPDIQIIQFNDQTSVYVKGEYVDLRNAIMKISTDNDIEL